MNDNEIIKALECCSSEHSPCSSECPGRKVGCEIEKYALDLIIRQQADIERLECSIISQDEEKLSYVAMLIKEAQERIRLEQIRRLEAEIERLEAKCENTQVGYNFAKDESKQWQEEANRYQKLWCEAVMDLQTIKSEAIKEFAERLKERAFHDMNDGEAIVCCCDIDEIVEEMTERKDEGK